MQAPTIMTMTITMTAATTGQIRMRYVIKGILYFVILAALGVVGYAYLGDLTPDQADMSQPVVLDVD